MSGSGYKPCFLTVRGKTLTLGDENGQFGHAYSVHTTRIEKKRIKQTWVPPLKCPWHSLDICMKKMITDLESWENMLSGSICQVQDISLVFLLLWIELRLTRGEGRNEIAYCTKMWSPPLNCPWHSLDISMKKMITDLESWENMLSGSICQVQDISLVFLLLWIELRLTRGRGGMKSRIVPKCDLRL